MTVTASTSNQAPTANAGPDQSVSVGATVQLTSAGSSDPEGSPLGYFWSFTTKPAGSTADFSNANAANPTFVADLAGTYVAQLIVNDGALDSAPDTVQIIATALSADVRVTKTVDNATPTIGQNVTFTVQAINDGPGVASGVVVQDLLPSGYTFVSKAVFNGSYDEATGVWTVGGLNLNQIATLSITATVKTTGSYDNTATKTASTPTDPNAGNNSVTAVVTPQASADVRVTKTVDNATPTIGQNVTFTVQAINDGPGVASGVVVQDLLPSGYTFVSKTVFNGSYDEATGVWTVGGLNLNQIGDAIDHGDGEDHWQLRQHGDQDGVDADRPECRQQQRHGGGDAVTPRGRAGDQDGGQRHADDWAERDVHGAGDQRRSGGGVGGGGAGPAAERLHVRVEDGVQRQL